MNTEAEQEQKSADNPGFAYKKQIIAAVIFTILIEALRPLAVLKWVVIPLTLILLMLFRPQGLFGFTELKLNLGLKPRPNNRTPVPTTEAQDATPSD